MVPDDTLKAEVEELYQKYNQDVMKYAMFLTKNQSDAEDIAQNTWIYIIKNIDKLNLDHEYSLKNYIFKITLSKTQDFVKINNRIKLRTEKFLSCYTPSPREDQIIYDLCLKIDIDIIIETILSLPQTYRDVLNLYYLGKEKLVDIGDILNIGASTARSRLNRGRKILIDKLKEKGVDGYE